MSAKHLKGTGGNYVPKVLAIGLCAMLEPGTVTAIVVTHDPSCGIHAGNPCDCDPDVQPQSRRRVPPD